MALKAWKIVGEVWGIELDEDGAPIAEKPVAQVTVYRQGFGDLPATIDGIFEQLAAQGENSADLDSALADLSPGE